VTKIDFSGKVKRIKFHFVKTNSKHDEWIEFRSLRIAALYSKTPAPKKAADKKRPVTDVSRDETVKDATSQVKAAKEPGAKNGKKKARLHETKGTMSSESDSAAQDETAKDPTSQVKAAKEPGAKNGKKKARPKETKGVMSSKSDSAAQDETATDPNSQGKPGTKNGKKKARLNVANDITASTLDSVAQDETAKDPNSQGKTAKEPSAKNVKKKARLNELKGITSSELDSVAQDETAKDPHSQGKTAKKPGAKNGKKKAQLRETKGITSTKSDIVARDESAKKPDSQGKAAKEPGSKNGKKKAQLNETKANTSSKSKAAVLSENDSMRLASLNHGPSTKIPKKKRVSVVPSNIQTATGADLSSTRFGMEAGSKKEEGSRLENVCEGPAPAATHYPPSATAGHSPQFSVAMPAESYRSGTMKGPIAESSDINGGIHMGTNPASCYQQPRGQRLAPSTSPATRLPDFTTESAPASTPFDQLLRLASVANVPTSNGSQFDHPFGQQIPRPSSSPPPFDQLLRLASVANVPTSNGSQFDHPFGPHIPQPSNSPPSGGPPFGYVQPNFLDSRSRMQPANLPPATSAPQDPSFQRGSDGAANFDQYRFQDRQTHNQHPPRYYR
jgi:hypothetical protein